MIVLPAPGSSANSRARAGVALELLHLEDLPFRIGFRTRREILADALAVEPTGDPEKRPPQRDS